MNAAQLMFLGVLCLPGLLLVILAVKRMRPRRKAKTDYMLAARHAVINKHLPPRGDTLLESLVMSVFCAVVAAAIVVCLSDEEDLQVSASQSLQVFTRKERP